ncbi:MAG: hypothetical protein HONBIEJF_00336 [Fimbriimonadaceae bacterium]|nr:hypothetical protein [Fimbriimonadaceae bacterium]
MGRCNVAHRPRAHGNFNRNSLLHPFQQDGIFNLASRISGPSVDGFQLAECAPQPNRFPCPKALARRIDWLSNRRFCLPSAAKTMDQCCVIDGAPRIARPSLDGLGFAKCCDQMRSKSAAHSTLILTCCCRRVASQARKPPVTTNRQREGMALKLNRTPALDAASLSGRSARTQEHASPSLAKLACNKCDACHPGSDNGCGHPPPWSKFARTIQPVQGLERPRSALRRTHPDEVNSITWDPHRLECRRTLS